MSEQCDTCLQPCQGGVHRYRDARGHERVGCQDERACADAWSKLSPPDRRRGGHDCRAVQRAERAAERAGA